MKKLLLIVATAFVALSVNAQELEDITPAGYDFGSKEVGQLTIQEFLTGANQSAYFMQNSDKYDEGLFFVCGGQFANPAQTYAADLQAGVSIVDLGGDAGKVWCVSGMNSTINDVLKEKFGVDLGGRRSIGPHNWFNFDWATDPQNTPTTNDKDKVFNIRCRLVLNIFANDMREGNDLINHVYCMDDANNQHPAGSQSTKGNNVSTGSTVAFDEFGDPLEVDGALVWDPNSWLVLEWDANCPVGDEGAQYAPLRIKMEMNNGNLQGATMFIKEISFFKVEDNEEPIISEVKKSYETYTVSPTTAIKSIAHGENGVGRQMYTISGIKVNPENARNGIFIQKNAGKTVKVIR